MNRWTKPQYEYAKNQGWNIFAIDGDQDNLKIQKIDEQNIFDSDEDALNFVKTKANLGDMFCLAALEIVHETK
ncbi:MAG: hypothetical protein WC554_09295 [Clostridia bacterium]